MDLVMFGVYTTISGSEVTVKKKKVLREIIFGALSLLSRTYYYRTV